MTTAADVIAGRAAWAVEAADCLDWLRALPADSLDLVVTSPPYERRRSYGIGFARAGEAWAAWMVEVVRECVRACRGLVAVVCEGETTRFRYSGAPLLLGADLIRAGYTLRKPCIYRRHGIPGARADWLRNDFEFVLCVTRPGRLPWSDPTACGHAPLLPAGGPMSARGVNGERRRRVYTPPDTANPGNVINCGAGGNVGSRVGNESEAPFPEKLADFFVRSFCPPGGLVGDPFAGSGTTPAVAVGLGRRAVGCDVRPGQVALAAARCRETTPPLPGFAGRPPRRPRPAAAQTDLLDFAGAAP